MVAMTFRKTYLLTISLLLALAVGFAAGFWARHYVQEPRVEFPTLAQAYEILRDHGLKQLPEPPVLEYGMIHGMVRAYDDPYTLFVEPVQHELEGNTLQGSFGGIGVSLNRDELGDVILYPYPDGPAFAAGVRDADRLVQVDDLPITSEVTIETIQAAVRGPVGERVRISVQRPPDMDLLEFSIPRAEIALPSVTWHLFPDQPKLGVIKVNLIAASSNDEIAKAIQDLRLQGASLFILDLRDNFGGLLTAGVDIARMFLHDGVVIEQQFRNQDVRTYRVEQAGIFADVPLAVLVNQHTASAAEIIAGAIQVQDRAPLVGRATFGKDSIQLIFDLDDSSSIHITAAKWWVPGLEPPIGQGGLQPDILVDADVPADGPDPVLRAAAEYLLETP